jgi:hypothetical protein
MKKRFSEEQIIGFLREAESSRPAITATSCGTSSDRKRHRIRSATALGFNRA